MTTSGVPMQKLDHEKLREIAEKVAASKAAFMASTREDRLAPGVPAWWMDWRVYADTFSPEVCLALLSEHSVLTEEVGRQKGLNNILSEKLERRTLALDDALAPNERMRKALEEAKGAYDFVLRVGGLSHTQDEDYCWPDDDLEIQEALNRLIAGAREMMNAPLRQILGEALALQGLGGGDQGAAPTEEAAIPVLLERAGRGERLTPVEQSACTGYELGWRDGRSEAGADLAVLRVALWPFAEACEGCDEGTADNHTAAWESPMAMAVTYGDFRLAASALATLKAGDQEAVEPQKQLIDSAYDAGFHAGWKRRFVSESAALHQGAAQSHRPEARGEDAEQAPCSSCGGSEQERWMGRAGEEVGPCSVCQGVEPDLIERLLDAQQDINIAANSTMDQSLCNASALIDEIEPILRAALSAAPLPSPPEQGGN